MQQEMTTGYELCISAAESNKEQALSLARACEVLSSLKSALNNNRVTFAHFQVQTHLLPATSDLLTPSEQTLNMPLAHGGPVAHSRSICLLVFAALTANVASICWSIDGFEESNRLVCDPRAEVSNCCSPSDICYSNGLCGGVQEAHNNTLHTPFFIGACTQQDFEDPKCAVAPKCRQDNNTGFGVVNCGRGYFCCYGIGNCGAGCPAQEVCDCDGVSDVFSLPPGSVMTSLPISTASETNADTTTSTAQTANVSSVTTIPASTATTSTPNIDATDGPTNIQSSGSTSDPGLSIGAKAGIGVACGIAVLAALAAAILYRTKRRRRNRAKADSKTLMEQAGQQQSLVAQQKHKQDQTIAELDAQDHPQELSDANARSELEGTYRGNTH